VSNYGPIPTRPGRAGVRHLHCGWSAPPNAAHPRVATTPMMLLRAEYAMRGIPSVPDEILIDILDEVFLPLIRGCA